MSIESDSDRDNAIFKSGWNEALEAMQKFMAERRPPASSDTTAREELAFIVHYLGHNDQDANHAWMVRRIRAVLDGKDPRAVKPWSEEDMVPRRTAFAVLREQLEAARVENVLLRARTTSQKSNHAVPNRLHMMVAFQAILGALQRESVARPERSSRVPGGLTSAETIAAAAIASLNMRGEDTAAAHLEVEIDDAFRGQVAWQGFADLVARAEKDLTAKAFGPSGPFAPSPEMMRAQARLKGDSSAGFQPARVPPSSGDCIPPEHDFPNVNRWAVEWVYANTEDAHPDFAKRTDTLAETLRRLHDAAIARVEAYLKHIVDPETLRRVRQMKFTVNR